MVNLALVGITDWRNDRQPFGIKDQDRLGHIYCIGKTGTGKSTLLMNLAISDIEKGNGICIIDPHGDLAEVALNYVPLLRIDDVIFLNATDLEFPIAFNPLHSVRSEDFNLVCSSILSTFKKVWSDSWGPRLEHILRFSLLTLLHSPDATLLDIQPLLTDTYFRNGVLNFVPDPIIRAFWLNEFDKYPPALKSEAIAPVLNKAGVFLSSLPLRNMFGQRKNAIQMQDILDNGKILICNLSKGQIGEEASAILGSMILSSIQSAALFRASYEMDKRRPFYLYVDEMHTFVTLSFADILAEARKYGLSLFLTHQYIEQVQETIRAAIFGNVGTVISFRIGAEDARYLAREFYPIFSEDDLVHLPRYSMYLKLMIDGATSKPFSAITLQLKSYSKSYKSEIVELSRKKYASERATVEQQLFEKARTDKSQSQSLFDI